MDKSIVRYTVYKRPRVLADGSIKEYIVRKSYNIKTTPLSPELINEMHNKRNMGVPKKKLQDEYGVSYYMINKYLSNNPHAFTN